MHKIHKPYKKQKTKSLSRTLSDFRLHITKGTLKLSGPHVTPCPPPGPPRPLSSAHYPITSSSKAYLCDPLTNYSNVPGLQHTYFTAPLEAQAGTSA